MKPLINHESKMWKWGILDLILLEIFIEPPKNMLNSFFPMLRLP